MVAFWETPTIWLSQERHENLCIFVCSMCHMKPPVHLWVCGPGTVVCAQCGMCV